MSQEYDPQVVRSLFDQWEGNELDSDLTGCGLGRWMVPHVNHLILDRWLPEQGRTLDAGSGCGLEAVRMACQGLQITALDISPGLLRDARRRAEAAGVADSMEFVEADLTQPLPLPRDYFDVCLALTGVISHTGPRHREAAANLVAVCKSGGLIIAGVQSYFGKIRQYLATGREDEARLLLGTHYTCTVSDTFADYCFLPNEFVAIFQVLGCYPEFITGVPGIAPDGYAHLSDEAFALILPKVLAMEQHLLGTPELLGMGEQLVGVFRKKQL
jgi:hypothetical protein